MIIKFFIWLVEQRGCFYLAVKLLALDASVKNGPSVRCAPLDGFLFDVRFGFHGFFRPTRQEQDDLKVDTFWSKIRPTAKRLPVERLLSPKITKSELKFSFSKNAKAKNFLMSQISELKAVLFLD